MKLYCEKVANGNVGAPSGTFEIVDHVVDLPREDGVYVLESTDMFREHKEPIADEGEPIAKVVKPDVVKRSRAK